MFGSNGEWAFGMGIGMWLFWIILIGLVVVLVRVIGCNRCSVSSDEPDHACGGVMGMANQQVRAVLEKIDDLQRLHKALNEMAARHCSGHYKIEDCQVVGALFDGLAANVRPD